MSPLSRDVPKGAAAVIVALALVASVVTGREPARDPHPAPAKAPPAAVAAPVEEIDMKRLARLRGEREIQDLFAPPSRPVPVAVAAPDPVPAPAAKPEPPPAPTAPPLPFAYLGRITKAEQVSVYLLRNQEMYLVEAGAALDQDYRLESVSDTSLAFVYLPLGTKQLLAIPPSQQGQP